jgi:spore coat polysaccharide biosynthesis protein SpsF
MSGRMILAVLQARMSSSRLPGKVLMPLCGEPMLLRQIERLGGARRLDRLLVATSVDASDDALAGTLGDAGVAVVRGPLHDVLARFVAVLDAHPAEHVVRLTGDCPLVDPDVVDATVDLHLRSGADYTSNTPGAFSFPKGLDVEVMTACALRRAASEARSPQAKEHVTWDFYHGDLGYRSAWLTSSRPDDGEIRWTVDTAEDYGFVAEVYAALYPSNPAFTSEDVRALLRRRPDLAQFGGHRRL